MPISPNRALQVRIANRVRSSLARDAVTGLPVLDALSDVDQRELCEMGGGRLAAVVICARHEDLREVVSGIATRVRRTDLFGRFGDPLREPDGSLREPQDLDRPRAGAQTLVVLAPGLDAAAGGVLASRIRELVRLPALSCGVAFRSAASPLGWNLATLIAEAMADKEPLTSTTS